MIFAAILWVLILYYIAPWYFNILFQIVKRVLSGNTLKKVQIFGHDHNEWEPVLRKMIDKEELPKQFGGNRLDYWNSTIWTFL